MLWQLSIGLRRCAIPPHLIVFELVWLTQICATHTQAGLDSGPVMVKLARNLNMDAPGAERVMGALLRFLTMQGGVGRCGRRALLVFRSYGQRMA